MDNKQIKDFKDAGIFRRLIAFLVDVFLIVVIQLWLVSLTSSKLLWEVQTAIVIPLIFMFYQTYLVYKVGQTIGGKIMGIQVVTVDSLKVPLRKAFFRGICIAVISSPVDVAIVLHILILLSIVISILLPPDPKIGKRRHVFDLLCGTCVIKAPSLKESNS